MTTSYYAVTDCHGPISRRLLAAGDDEAMDALRQANSQAWIDEPATDAEDDLGIAGDGMGPAEFAERLQRAGLEWVGEYDGWDLWRPMRCCPVCGDGVPLSGAPSNVDWVPCCPVCREYHERFGDRADVRYATERRETTDRMGG